jgi:hypothetical protein
MELLNKMELVTAQRILWRDDGRADTWNSTGWMEFQRDSSLHRIEWVDIRSHATVLYTVSVNSTLCMSLGEWGARLSLAGIFKQWMGEEPSRNKVIVPEAVFVDHLRSPGIDSQPSGPVRQPYFSYRPAEPHWLTESISRNRFQGSINDYKYVLCSPGFIGWRHWFLEVEIDSWSP